MISWSDDFFLLLFIAPVRRVSLSENMNYNVSAGYSFTILLLYLLTYYTLLFSILNRTGENVACSSENWFILSEQKFIGSFFYSRTFSSASSYICSLFFSSFTFYISIFFMFLSIYHYIHLFTTILLQNRDTKSVITPVS